VLDPAWTYECLQCSPWRPAVSGTIVAGPRTEPPDVVGTPTFSSSGNGSPRVGETLTADVSAVTVTPQDAVASYQWLRDDVEIPDATGTTYELSDDDAGHSVSFRVGSSLDGFDDAAPVHSAPVSVARRAATLGVSVPRGPQWGGRLEVTVSGLQLDEPYTVHVAGIHVGDGTATTADPFTRWIDVPAGLGDGVRQVTVTGSESDRTGSTSTRIVGTGTLQLDVAASVVRPRQQQVLRVTGLTTGERVVLNYRGVQISPKSAKGDARGVYRQVFRVGDIKGGKFVRAAGAFHDRPARGTFALGRS
jgi:hypothetical protein